MRYATLVAVCKECAGEPKALRKALKRAFKERGRRDVRVVASSCLDVCPKRATTVAAGADGLRVLVVKPGARAEDVADALLPGDQNSRG